MAHTLLLELTRGGRVESQHTGAITVADAQGRLVAACGDPERVVFLRSSAKPLQVLPVIESGAARAFAITPRELAVACASHTGAAIHLEAVRGLQARLGLTEADLGCGAHMPDDPASGADLICRGAAPTPVYNNCSGKHTGMLAVARHLGWPLAGYLAPEHPLQQLILRTVAEMFAVAPEAVGLGVDGCSAPNFAVPMRNAAAAFARLADPDGLPAPRAAAARAAFAAMTAHPEMVQCPGGSDTELMRALPGRLIAKRGAEGYQAIGLAPGALRPGSPALGIAIKVDDGAARAVPPIAVEVLRQLGALGPEHLAQLAAAGVRAPEPLYNWERQQVGEARPVFQLAFG